MSAPWNIPEEIESYNKALARRPTNIALRRNVDIALGAGIKKVDEQDWNTPDQGYCSNKASFKLNTPLAPTHPDPGLAR